MQQQICRKEMKMRLFKKIGGLANPYRNEHLDVSCTTELIKSVEVRPISPIVRAIMERKKKARKNWLIDIIICG
jgi:hypothetical protein